MNFPRALAGFSSWLFKPELAEDTPDNDENTVNPWRELLQKINVADLPDSSFSSGKELNVSVYDTFEHFCKIRDYDAVGELLLAFLDKVTKERDQFRDEISQLRMHINDLKASKCVLGETLLSYRHRIEVGEKQTEALIVRLADLQSQVMCQPARKVSADKVRALIGKEWDPITWDGDVWEDIDSDGTEEAELTTVLVSPSLSEESGYALSKERAQQDKADAPQNQSSTSLVTSEPVTRPKSLSDLTSQKHRHTNHELKSLAQSNHQQAKEHSRKWILRVWDNGGRLTILDQTEFLSLGPLSLDSEFNVIARTVEDNGVKSLFDWLAEAWVQRWPTTRELQTPDALEWYSIEDGIKRLRELGMIEWLCVKATCPQWRGPEDAPITRAMRITFVRETVETWKSFVFSLLCIKDITVGGVAAQLHDLIELSLKPTAAGLTAGSAPVGSVAVLSLSPWKHQSNS
ncbi:Friend virus susceptibility protein 1 [Mus caroli]|uniref:Friend virus susceptibility protein 1 n=1 Tax=Mus caroli TaxID=10089 RepID=B9VU53_MUSCR|nr:Friend virus susceptibility protein 1 [Mus caroli]ACM16074.1 Fv1 gammaretrovirus restriction factor [Mus caroli]